jgi:hypothetical protein
MNVNDALNQEENIFKSVRERARELAKGLGKAMGPETLGADGKLNDNGKRVISEMLLDAVKDLGDREQAERVVASFMAELPDEPIHVQMRKATIKNLRTMAEDLETSAPMMTTLAKELEEARMVFQLGEARGYLFVARSLLTMAADVVEHAYSCECVKPEEPKAAEGEVAQ